MLGRACCATLQMRTSERVFCGMLARRTSSINLQKPMRRHSRNASLPKRKKRKALTRMTDSRGWSGHYNLQFLQGMIEKHLRNDCSLMCSCIIGAVYYHWIVSADEVLHIEPDFQVSFPCPQPHEGVCSSELSYPAFPQKPINPPSRSYLLPLHLILHKHQKRHDLG